MASRTLVRPKNLPFFLLFPPALLFCYLYFAMKEPQKSQAHYIPTVQNTTSRVWCDANNRPKAEDCEHVARAPTCGYYKDDCPFEICGLPDDNGCYSCSDLSVLYYEPGDCKPEIVVDSCYEDKCKGKEEAWGYFNPICGFKDNCDEQVCTQTFDNLCSLCVSEDYRLFQYGVCESDKIYCESEDFYKRCKPNSNKPVCAFFGTMDDLFVSTSVSDCQTACQDTAVEYYLPKACGPTEDNNVFCLPNMRPDIDTCPDVEKPVCGFYGGEGRTGSKTFLNNCHACADLDISFYWSESCN